MVAMVVGIVLVASGVVVLGAGAWYLTAKVSGRSRRQRGPSGSHPAGRGGAGIASLRPQPHERPHERPQRGAGPRGPDDDPEFLRSLQERLRREDGAEGRDGDA